MKIGKYSGKLMIATGIIHNAIGVIMGWSILKEIWMNGFFNTITTQMDRAAIFWFLFSGFLMMMIGKMMDDYIIEFNSPLPSKIGYYLLVLVVTGAAMMPVSGFWIVIPQALLIIFSAQKKEKLASV
jgi:hypothetical protein